MFVIPAAEVSLDDTMFRLLKGERGPTVRRGVKGLDLVGIVREKLTQGAPVIAIFFLDEAGNPGSHGDDAVLSHKSNRFAIDCFDATLVNDL